MSYSGIMFHQLGENSEINGVINEHDFYKLVDQVSLKSNIINSTNLCNFPSSGPKNNHNYLLTFDDGMRCHYDYALSWLEKINIKAIFFIHTQPVIEGYDRLIAVKHFALTYFSQIDSYYDLFDYFLKRNYKKNIDIAIPENFLKEYSFYSIRDKRYRYLRDFVLSDDEYFQIVEMMMLEKRTSYQELTNSGLYLERQHIKEISEMGHLIGLHTHTHPTNISKKSYIEQREEFSRNKEILESITNKNVIVASFPCGRYNDHTIDIMNELGIKYSFTSSMQVNGEIHNLKLPRIDPGNMIIDRG